MHTVTSAPRNPSPITMPQPKESGSDPLRGPAPRPRRSEPQRVSDCALPQLPRIQHALRTRTHTAHCHSSQVLLHSEGFFVKRCGYLRFASLQFTSAHRGAWNCQTGAPTSQSHDLVAGVAFHHLGQLFVGRKGPGTPEAVFSRSKHSAPLGGEVLATLLFHCLR